MSEREESHTGNYGPSMQATLSKYPHHGRLRSLLSSNSRLARRLWGQSSREVLQTLRYLTVTHSLSVAAGDLQLLDGRWYVTHTGLLRLSQRKHCSGIHTALQKDLSDPVANRWVFKATVYKSPSSRGFVGFGDADPSNVSTTVHGAELRIAETRAVNRALRKAYGIGLCSLEELGALSRPSKPAPSPAAPSSNGSDPSNGSGNGQPRLRDQLCLLIRQYNLDANLVKAYAADFCGTEKLSGASRELVESFISHLSAALVVKPASTHPDLAAGRTAKVVSQSAWSIISTRDF